LKPHCDAFKPRYCNDRFYSTKIVETFI